MITNEKPIFIFTRPLVNAAFNETIDVSGANGVTYFDITVCPPSNCAVYVSIPALAGTPTGVVSSLPEKGQYCIGANSSPVTVRIPFNAGVITLDGEPNALTPSDTAGAIIIAGYK